MTAPALPLEPVTPSECRRCGSGDVRVASLRPPGVHVVTCNACKEHTSPETLVLTRRVHNELDQHWTKPRDGRSFERALDDLVKLRQDDPPDAGDDEIIEVVVLRRKVVRTTVEVL